MICAKTAKPIETPFAGWHSDSCGFEELRITRRWDPEYHEKRNFEWDDVGIFPLTDYAEAVLDKLLLLLLLFMIMLLPIPALTDAWVR